MSPEGAFVAGHAESFTHGNFQVVVDGAQLTVEYDDPVLQGDAVALGRRYVSHLTLRTGASISWMPNTFRSPSSAGTRELVSLVVEDRVSFAESLSIIVTNADGTVEPMRTDKDLAPSAAVMRCLESFPNLLKGLDYGAEYMRTRNLKPLSRLWDVLMAATEAGGDQGRHAAIATSVGQPAGWANDVGQSLHALRHEVSDQPRLAEETCFERARAALLAFIDASCP